MYIAGALPGAAMLMHTLQILSMTASQHCFYADVVAVNWLLFEAGRLGMLAEALAALTWQPGGAECAGQLSWHAISTGRWERAMRALAGAGTQIGGAALHARLVGQLVCVKAAQLA